MHLSGTMAVCPQEVHVHCICQLEMVYSCISRLTERGYSYCAQYLYMLTTASQSGGWVPKTPGASTVGSQLLDGDRSHG